jgi:hypothetical protein
MADDENESEQPEAEIIRLTSVKAPPPGIEKVERKFDDCAHRRVFIDEILRRVFCATCEEQLDAVSVLLDYARHERRLHYVYISQSREMDQRYEELKKLKRLEQNAKARLNRAQKGLTGELEPGMCVHAKSMGTCWPGIVTSVGPKGVEVLTSRGQRYVYPRSAIHTVCVGYVNLADELAG